MRTAKELFNEVADKFSEELTNGGRFSDIGVAARIDDNHGLVVWGDDYESEGYVVTVRENFTEDIWGDDIICESTDTRDYEQLEVVVNSVMEKFYNR